MEKTQEERYFHIYYKYYSSSTINKKYIIEAIINFYKL